MTELILVDFSGPDAEASWQIVNDVVMGGVSRSGFQVTEKATGIFRGNVSLENNGGFASVRTVPGAHDLSGCDGIFLRVRGDGRRYRFRLRTDDRYDGIAYTTSFETRPDSWETIRMPFSLFRATYHGRGVPDAPPLDPGRVRRFGFLIADKQAGSFKLEIDRIGTYLDNETETVSGR